MLIEVTNQPRPTAKEGDIVVLKNQPYLVIITDLGKYNIVGMDTGMIYFLNNHSIADLNVELQERDAIIYSSDEYMLTLKRRNL